MQASFGLCLYIVFASSLPLHVPGFSLLCLDHNVFHLYPKCFLLELYVPNESYLILPVVCIFFSNIHFWWFLNILIIFGTSFTSQICPFPPSLITSICYSLLLFFLFCFMIWLSPVLALRIICVILMFDSFSQAFKPFYFDSPHHPYRSTDYDDVTKPEDVSNPWAEHLWVQLITFPFKYL